MLSASNQPFGFHGSIVRITPPFLPMRHAFLSIKDLFGRCTSCASDAKLNFFARMIHVVLLAPFKHE